MPAFRRLVRELTFFLIVECTADLRVAAARVATPLAEAEAVSVAEPVVLVPVLRAGLGMAEAALELLPDARVGHVGLYRDERTHEPVAYYVNTPCELPDALVLVLDPMLATGGSAAAALGMLRQRGARRVKLCSLIAAPEGVARLRAAHPEVELYTVAVDERLDERAYIIPGLGDAGDRMFGTLQPGGDAGRSADFAFGEGLA